MSNARFRIRLVRSLFVTPFKANLTVWGVTWKALANSVTTPGSLRIFPISSFVYLILIFSALFVAKSAANKMTVFISSK